jgi:hypothetical protein
MLSSCAVEKSKAYSHINYPFHFLKEPEARELSEEPELFLCPNVLGDSSRAPSFLMNF